MAIHANSTPAPERTLLRKVAAPGRLLPPPRGTAPGHSELLAILAGSPPPHTYRRKAQRQAMQAGIDALIDYLDAITPDPDLEHDGSDEPYMSWCESGAGAQRDTSFGGDECEDGGDSEPSLGAPEVESHLGSSRIDRRGHIDQRRWADGRLTDGEDEPSLGSRDASGSDRFWPGQLAWSAGYQRKPWLDECESVSEDEGACIQSQPHDEYEQDREPALGATENVDQTRWGGSDSMFSDESEPSLGAPENPHDQSAWSQGAGSVELDHDEQGGLRSWGTYNDARLRTERLRKDTEAMLWRKGLVKSPVGEVMLIDFGTMMVRGCAL